MTLLCVSNKQKRKIMNNEETIIAQSNAQKQSEKKQEKTEGKGKTVAATVAASTVGGAVGGAGTATAMNYAAQEKAEEHETEEQNAEEQAASEQSTTAEEQTVTAEAKPETDTEPKPEPEPQVEETPRHDEQEMTARVDDPAEPDYTGNGGADPVVETATVQSTTEDAAPQVQVLGVYENVTDEGIHQTAAVLTNGEEYAFVADVTGDGIVDILGVDENLNGQLDEGEVHDVSAENVPMSVYEDAYLAQQQEQEQMDTMAYNTSDDMMPDYDNDALIDA